MAFPISNYSRVWVRGKLIDLAKAAREVTNYGATGPIQFIPTPDKLVDATTGQIIDPTPMVTTPAVTDGAFSIQLPATNDPDINPSGWNYQVVPPFGDPFYIVVPYDTAILDSVGDPLDGQRVIELSTVVPDPDANGGQAQVISGADGRGITSMDIDGSNHLIITYTDSSTDDAGLVPTAGLDAEAVRDEMGTALVGGTGITVTPNDGADTITIATTITQYTDALARAAGRRVVGLTDGATITPDSSTTDIGYVTLGGNRTMEAPTGTPVDGQKLLLEIVQDGTGSRTLTWNSAYRFSAATTPTLTTTAGKTDYFGFIWNAGSSKWDCIAERYNF